MAEIRFAKRDAKIKNVPIAVTPDGFWCCPSPVVFHKNLKQSTTVVNKPKPPNSPPPSLPHPKNPTQNAVKPTVSEEINNNSKTPADVNVNVTAAVAAAVNVGSHVAVGGEKSAKSKAESLPRKVSIEFGESGTSDVKVVLYGKHGFSVKLNVHKRVMIENSSFFAEKLGGAEGNVSCLRVEDCEDVEIYVETVGLMYSKDVKQRLIKQSVQRVLRILKVAEVIGFSSCVQSCLDYLEAAPWVGDEEEEKVVSSVLRLQSEGVGVNPVLKRVSSKISKPPKDTLSHIIELVLKSNEERGRREMKSVVLKLLRENNTSGSNSETSPDVCYDAIYNSSRRCLDSLLSHFRQAVGPEPNELEPAAKKIALESDNLSWLLDILAERQVADEFALMWASQQELAGLHQKLPIMTRYHVSCITARVFVGIGRGELLPSKETRHLLLQTWLEPLMSDYSWLNHGCRSFDRTVVEEGIGRTILTLPLEDQQSILLSWLSSFLKSGDNCPNLQRAFEVWWRRTFIRPYNEARVSQGQTDNAVKSISRAEMPVNQGLFDKSVQDDVE